MKKKIAKKLIRRKQRIQYRLRNINWRERNKPMFSASNIICNGDCLEDIERLRNDEVYLDALGAERIPDPTTAGDFCRRYTKEDVETLMDIINEVRLGIWQSSPTNSSKKLLLMSMV